MIALFTDFSITDPYLGLMKIAIYQDAPNCRIVDICHDMPAFNPNASGRLLQALVRDLPDGLIILAVIDPGVGTERHPLWLEADGKHFIGPDNGLFARIINQAANVEAHVLEFDSTKVSASFHGRDVFAPAAAQIEAGKSPASYSIDHEKLVGTTWPDELSEIIYIDNYGNAMTGITGENVTSDKCFVVNEIKIHYARTFDDKIKGRPFWYKNSIGLVEFAQYNQSASELKEIKLGDKVN